MFDSHDRVLEKLAASGGKEFSLETLKAVMEEVWQEGAARHEQEVMQSAEQEEVYETLSAFMKENNNQGMELTEGDLLTSFRQAKQHTGYFAGDNEPVEPTSWAQASEGLELTPQREQSAELER